MGKKNRFLLRTSSTDFLYIETVSQCFNFLPFFMAGMCAKCGGEVLGEATGCQAMDNIFHVKCFTCSVCCKFRESCFIHICVDVCQSVCVIFDDTSKALLCVYTES